MNSTNSPSTNSPMVKSRVLEKENVQGKKISPSSEDIIRLPGELLGRILTFLSGQKDLLAFELVFSRAIQYTGPAWECLAKQERLDFDWSLSDQDKKWNPEKAHYLHGKVLVVYSIAKSKQWTQAPDRQWIPPSFQEVQKLFERFEGIMRRYPSTLGAFLWKDLNALHKVNSASDNQLFQRNFSVELSTGDLLLKGLSCLTEHTLLNPPINQPNVQLRRNASTSLKQAILKGATCASDLAIQILHPKYLDPYWYYYLTLDSMAQGDYRGLELLLEKFPDAAELFYNQGVSDPPVLVKIAKTKLSDKLIQEAEVLFDEAIKGYKDHVPPFVYADAASTKFKLKKFGESEDYCIKTITAFGNNVPAYIYKNTALVKIELNKLGEAEDCYTKAITAYGNNVLASIYADIVPAKLLLNKLEEAEDYSIKAITAHGDNVPTYVYVNAALAKFRLNKLEEAEDYITEAIAAYGNNVPASIYAQAADIKARLGRWKEAKEYSDKALAAFKDNVPNLVLEQAAEIAKKLAT